jgi:hypothetical protein
MNNTETSAQCANHFIQKGATNFRETLKALASCNVHVIELLKHKILKKEIAFTEEDFFDTLNNDIMSSSRAISEDTMELLIKYGADNYDAGLIQCAKMNNTKKTAHFAKNLNEVLIQAVYRLNARIVKVLIESGARNLNSALTFHITGPYSYEREKILRMLISHGADVNEGMKLAIDNESLDLATMFVQIGADIIRTVARRRRRRRARTRR